MTMVLSVLLIAVVAVAIALPLLRGPGEFAAEGNASTDQERRKRVAMLAIRETEFDRAMGKLSEEDYQALTSSYEARAIEAMGQMEATGATAAGAAERPANGRPTAYCGARGRGFEAAESFCSACGHRR